MIIWHRITVTLASAAALGAVFVHATMAGMVHRLAELWTNERTSGTQPIHLEWFYSQLKYVLTESPASFGNRAFKAHMRSPMSPESIAELGISSFQFAGLTIALPNTSASWLMTLFTFVALTLCVATVLYGIRHSGKQMRLFAAGVDSASTSWRRFASLRALALFMRRLASFAALLAAPAAAFLAFDRTHTPLSQASGYALTPGVLIWYWGIVAVLTWAFSVFVSTAWIGVALFRKCIPARDLCAECGYPRTDNALCSECGATARTRDIRRRALVASILTLLVTLGIVAYRSYSRRVEFYMTIRWLINVFPELYREQPLHILRFRWNTEMFFYFPHAWSLREQFAESDTLWFSDNGLHLESQRFRIRILPEDDGFSVLAQNLSSGTLTSEWTAQYVYQCKAYFDLEFEDLEISVIKPIVAFKPEISLCEQCNLAQISPRYRWRIVPDVQ